MNPFHLLIRDNRKINGSVLRNIISVLTFGLILMVSTVYDRGAVIKSVGFRTF